MKNKGLRLFIAVLILQICVPFGMIGYNTAVEYCVKHFGTVYYIPLDFCTYDIIDEKPMLCLDFRFHGFAGQYCSFDVDESGIAQCYVDDEKPDGDYILNGNNGKGFVFPEKYFEVEDAGLNNWHDLLLRLDPEDEFWGVNSEYNWNYYSYTSYAAVKVYKGHMAIEEVYINGVTANEFLAENKKLYLAYEAYMESQ